MYSAPSAPAHPLGPGTASPVHPLAARSKARAAAAMAHAMLRTGGNRDNGDHDVGGYDEEDAGAAAATANGRYSGDRSPLRNGGAYGYGGRRPLHAAAAGGEKNKYFGFALPKVFLTYSIIHAAN
jgi:hypothetical protein